MFLTSAYCIKHFGEPNVEMERKHLCLWNIPEDIKKEIPVLPNRIYCHKSLVTPLKKALENVIARDKACEIKTWDGCFNIRKKRGASSYSIHCWALAIDINAAWNGFGKEPQMSKDLVKCFEDAGFDWGGYWKKKDGMHFQLKVETIK